MSRSFQFPADEPGAVLNQVLMFRGESGGEVAVNIQFAHHLPMGEYGHDDL